MGIRIFTSSYEIHAVGFDSYYIPDMEGQFTAFVDDIIEIARNNDLKICDRDLAISFTINDELVNIGYIGGVLGPNRQLRIGLRIQDPHNLNYILNHRYGGLTCTDDSKQQLLDLLNGNYREEMKNE